MLYINKPSQETLEMTFSRMAEGHRDVVVSPRNFSVMTGIELNDPSFFIIDPELDKSHRISFSDSAMSQILNKVKIPAQFYNRCPMRLKVANLYHFNSEYSKDYLFRIDDSVDKGHVRAVLSDKYGVIDNKELFPTVFKALENRTDVSYRFVKVSPQITILVIDFNDCTKTFGGRIYSAGLSIINSETGHSSVWIEPTIYTTGRHAFSNRSVLQKQGIDCRIVHRGSINLDRVHSIVEEAKKIAQVGIVQLIEANQQYISRNYALNIVSNVDALPTRFQQIVEEEWESKAELTRAEVAHRILEFAKELPLFKQLRITQSAGKITGIFDDYKSRFIEIMKEIHE